MRELGLALLAAAWSTANLWAATPDAEASRRLRTLGEADVVVVFERDRAPASEARQAALVRAQAEISRHRREVEALLGADRPRIRACHWLSNSVSLAATPRLVEALGALPGVRSITWDGPVYWPVVGVVRAPKRTEGPWTWGLRWMAVDQIRARYKLTGKGVLVGVIDTGADGKHPDLAGKFAAYKDFTGYSNEPIDLETDGHDSHVSGTIVGGDASGTAIGVAPGARLVVARATVGVEPVTHMLNSMQWMTDPDGDPATDDAPRVVNMSWHLKNGAEPFYAALETWERLGIFPCFAVGNTGDKGVPPPHEHPYAFNVAALLESGEVARYSAKGPAAYLGTKQLKPEVGAPGAAVYSSLPKGQYGYLQGTSMAAPHVAGLIALMLEANPGLTPAALRRILIETATDAGPAGWDGANGFGRANGLKAVERALALRARRPTPASSGPAPRPGPPGTRGASSRAR